MKHKNCGITKIVLLNEENLMSCKSYLSEHESSQSYTLENRNRSGNTKYYFYIEI